MKRFITILISLWKQQVMLNNQYLLINVDHDKMKSFKVLLKNQHYSQDKTIKYYTKLLDINY
jgi:hypothetical protein